MSIPAPDKHSVWHEPAVDELRAEFASAYEDRTVLVTGADGFMGSHLTEALVHLGARRPRVRARHVERRAEQHLAPAPAAVHFADLTDRTSIDYLVKELRDRRRTARTCSTSERRRTSASRGTGPTRPWSRTPSAR